MKIHRTKVMDALQAQGKNMGRFFYRVGIPTPRLREILAGTIEPTDAEIAAITRVLGVPAADITDNGRQQ